MSFGGSRKMSNSDTKLKEKNEESLKNAITEKIFEIMTKNNLILNKVYL